MLREDDVRNPFGVDSMTMDRSTEAAEDSALNVPVAARPVYVSKYEDEMDTSQPGLTSILNNLVELPSHTINRALQPNEV